MLHAAAPTLAEGENPCVRARVSDGITPVGLLLCRCSAIISLYLASVRLHLNVSPATITHPSRLSSPSCPPHASSSRLTESHPLIDWVCAGVRVRVCVHTLESIWPLPFLSTLRAPPAALSPLGSVGFSLSHTPVV